MELPAKIFLGIILFVFTVLDISMIVSLIKPGDERNQIVVWKASTHTLCVVVGTMILNVIYGVVVSQSSLTNTFIMLEITAIIYFVELLSVKRKYGG